ncbi:MAG: TAXI family TRAP transporter solute-binding subunit [candidate division Zixibacteria bacterium]|nr:TAXI family TRAP transporter solute-binding subunit [candidate division Zixibacteria bacterium]
MSFNISRLVLGFVTLGLILCSVAEATDGSTIIRIATGMRGGGYYAIGEKMEKLAKARGLTVVALETEGSWESLKYLSEGKADFAFTQLNAFVKYSIDSSDTAIVVVIPLYTEYLHIVMRYPFEIRSFASLVGKKIFFGQPGSGTVITANLFLDVMGLSTAQFPSVDAKRFEEIQALFKKDSLDVAFHVGTINNKIVRDLMDSTKSSLFSLDRNTVRYLRAESRQEQLGILGIKDIPSGTYTGQEQPAMTIAMPVMLVTLQTMDSNKVDRIAKLVLKAIDSVQAEGNRDSTHSQGDMSLLRQHIKLAPKYWYDENTNKAPSQFRFDILAILLSFVLLVLILLWIFKNRTKINLGTLRYKSILIVSGIFLGACIVIPYLIYVLENTINESFGSFYETVWSTVLYLTSRLGGRTPVTLGGRLFVVLLLIAGSVLAALITGYITSKLIFNKLERKMDKNQKDHFVFLNWNDRAQEIVRQIHSPELGSPHKIVVVVLTDDPGLKTKELEERMLTKKPDTDFHHPCFIPGDPTDEECLMNVNILKARTIIIMADDKEKTVADDKSMKSLMTIQSLLSKQEKDSLSSDGGKKSKGMHIVIELLNQRNAYTVEKMSKLLPSTVTVDIIAQGQIRTLLLAHAAIIGGLVKFYKDLLTFDESNNELYLLDVDGLSHGAMTFPMVASHVVSLGGDRPVIPVGYQRTSEEGEVRLITNPKKYLSAEDKKMKQVNPSYIMKDGDRLLVIAYSKPSRIDLKDIELPKKKEELMN